MTVTESSIPVVLFVYARPEHLQRVLVSLRANNVPRLLVFSDGMKGTEDAKAVGLVRKLLRDINWCEIQIFERPQNYGLGENILDGVTQIAERYNEFIVWEDDLVCVPGSYEWMCAALRHYSDDQRVQSITAWTHPRIIPDDVTTEPYFDGRGECWVWGTWSRSWQGMTTSALEKMISARVKSLGKDAYGYDLPAMARVEAAKNLWAVRWLYHHIEQGGLCLRPPWSMVEHIGFDCNATNASQAGGWDQELIRGAPTIPVCWPTPIEHKDCSVLWKRAYPPRWSQRLKRIVSKCRLRGFGVVVRKIAGKGGAVLRRFVPPDIRRLYRFLFGWRWFTGYYQNWDQAAAKAGSYSHPPILKKVLASTFEVRAGRAVFERDSVAFYERSDDPALIEGLFDTARLEAGRLRVLDFGGSLGSIYWQHRAALSLLRELRWSVVEQPHYVEAGRRFFQNQQLRFFSSIAEAQEDISHDMLLLSCVIQYLPAPFDFLESCIELEIPTIILHNLPLHEEESTYIRVQHVPPEIYEASYPAWFFNRDKILSIFERKYAVARLYKSPAVWWTGWREYQSTGILLRRKGKSLE